MMDLDQYRLILESSPNMIWRANLTTECDYFNRTWLDFTGRTMEQEFGFGWAEGVHPDDLDRCVKIYLDNFKLQHSFEMDYRLKRHDGEYRWINDRGIPFYNDEGVFIGFIGSCMDVTEKIEGQRLIEMAQNDTLCKTFNRQYSHQLLEDVFNQAKEYGQTLTILMIDIDDFKRINDQFGHAAGDVVLAEIAAILKSNIRNFDILGRYGGDEFLVGLVNTDIKLALSIAHRVADAVSAAQISIPSAKPLQVTISVGVKSLEDESSLDTLIGGADKKLYEAKREGKNLVRA